MNQIKKETAGALIARFGRMRNSGVILRIDQEDGHVYSFVRVDSLNVTNAGYIRVRGNIRTRDMKMAVGKLAVISMDSVKHIWTPRTLKVYRAGKVAREITWEAALIAQ